MSIKRSREVSRRRTPEPEDGGRKKTERVYVWAEDVAAHSTEPFVAYAPAHKYEKDMRLVHKVFGAGIVTHVEGAKFEILFKDGAKKLAHNPAGTAAPVVPYPSADAQPAAVEPVAPSAPPAAQQAEAPVPPTDKA